MAIVGSLFGRTGGEAALWTFAAAVTVVPFGILVSRARRFLVSGFGPEELAVAFRTELEQGREERIFEYGRGPSLYERVLRFPLHHFDRTATGQVIAMMTGELEPVGGFIGDAFALPISQGGTLLTIFVFMFVQNPLLGAAAVALYPVQGYFIPKMQRRIRELGRQRVRKIRSLSDRIGESIAAQAEIRTNGGAQHHAQADEAVSAGVVAVGDERRAVEPPSHRPHVRRVPATRRDRGASAYCMTASPRFAR